MNSHNIHVKIEREELFENKIDILSTEEKILLIKKNLISYKELRLNELKLRTKLQKRLRETYENLSKIEKILPKPSVPEIIKKKSLGERRTKSKRRYDEDIESQIQDIKSRLKGLSGLY